MPPRRIVPTRNFVSFHFIKFRLANFHLNCATSQLWCFQALASCGEQRSFMALWIAQYSYSSMVLGFMLVCVTSSKMMHRWSVLIFGGLCKAHGYFEGESSLGLLELTLEKHFFFNLAKFMSIFLHRARKNRVNVISSSKNLCLYCHEGKVF